MPLTRTFRETVKERAATDQKFRNAMLTEGLESLVGGDFDTAKSMLRDYINATEGFESVSEALNIPPKSLMRMLSADGNPRSANLINVIGHLRKKAGVDLVVRLQPRRN